MCDNENCCGEYLGTDDVQEGVISGNTFDSKIVEYSVVDNQAVFEGDIILGSPDELHGDEAGLEGIGITGQQYRWSQGIVTYRIDSNLTDQQRVQDAIAHWEANTVLRFRQRTNEADFITFRPGNGCSSAVGKRGGEQFITLAPGCSTGNTIHEIGHAIGLWHEQSREDRNSFVTIDFTNIPAARRHNFRQHITDGDDIGAYDYGSIMHYSAFAFAIDTSKPTIIAPQPVGQRNGLSDGDRAAVATLYPVLLRLISLHCEEQEDFIASDEPYLRVDGNTVWGPRNMSAGQTLDLNSVPPFAVRSRAPIDLFDQDSPDPDDHLGRTHVRYSLASHGEQVHTFNGDGAKYHLRYELQGPR